MHCLFRFSVVTKCLLKRRLKHIVLSHVCMFLLFLTCQTLFKDFVYTALHRKMEQTWMYQYMHNNSRASEWPFPDIRFDHIYFFCTCFEFSFEFLNNNKFMNHPQISAILDDEEEECLHYLTTVSIKIGQKCY